MPLFIAVPIRQSVRYQSFEDARVKVAEFVGTKSEKNIIWTEVLHMV